MARRGAATRGCARSDVLVVGGLAASVGLYVVMSAVAHDAAAITYVDDDAARLSVASDLGAATIDVTDGWPDRLPTAGVVVENTGTSAGLMAALRGTAPHGTCTSVAIHLGDDVTVPLLSMYTKGITFHTSRADARRFLGRVLAELADGVLDPRLIPTCTVDSEDAANAWLEPAMRLVVTRD